MKAKKAAKIVKGFQHRKVEGEFLNPDTCRGRKDGRNAPDAWLASLQVIEADETNSKEQTRSTIRQTQAEANEHLALIEQSLIANKKTKEKLEEKGHLSPEQIAQSLYNSAVRDLILAILLAIIDLIAVIYIAKQIFGENTLIVVPMGILLTGSVILGIKALLGHLSPERKVLMRKAIIYTGLSLVLIGLVGLTLLRTTTFDIALSGEGAMNVGEVSLGNLLLMIGLGLGAPLVLGVIYEYEAEKLKTAMTSLHAYAEERELLKTKTEWQSLVERLQALDKSLDGVTEQIVKLRQNRYIRGFIRGIQKNPDAEKYIREISGRTGHDSFIPHRILATQHI